MKEDWEELEPSFSKKQDKLPERSPISEESHKELIEIIREGERIEEDRLTWLKNTPATKEDVENAANYVLDYIKETSHHAVFPYRIEKFDL